jgi:uncharacterized membrane protein
MANPLQEPEGTPRKRRYTIYLVGSAVAAAGITLGTMPMFRELTPILVAKGIALVGAMILAVGRFAPDSFLRRILPTRSR